MDVAKCGTKSKRESWKKKGYDLFVHNIGSSLIYFENNRDEVIRVLIYTHGLIGQYLKGEINLIKNKKLYELNENKLIDKQELYDVLYLLNKCIIGGISIDIWNKLKYKVKRVVNNIVNNNFEVEESYDKNYILKRLIKLKGHVLPLEKKEILKILSDENIRKKLGIMFENLEIWYLETSLYNFKYEEIIKLLLLVSNYYLQNIKCKHISFENVMKEIYIDYNNKRVINIYKQRIIEKYLKERNFDDIINNNIENQHVKIDFKINLNTILISFNFSKPSLKLIEFCEAAYGTDSQFNKAIFMLYDLFEFRRDEYDRFYNEIDYLKIMNASLSNKAIILNYINGNNILDIGPGGGALMDLITDEMPDKKVIGIDISSNVIEELNNKKIIENKKWNVIKGDALELNKYFKKEVVDTIIYSSIIHELFSYIEYNGRKFNYETIEKSLISAYDILPSKGIIIIRDGIMTEDKHLKRIIKFKNSNDMEILKRYCNDFKGRKINYEKLDNDTVMMYINDAMEFLYTYTWGEKSYSLEVKEQFGYFTPNEYINFINKIFNNNCKIIENQHFLQDGYEKHLLQKIEFYDEDYIPVSLPDSTCIIVIEKC